MCVNEKNVTNTTAKHNFLLMLSPTFGIYNEMFFLTQASLDFNALNS